MFELGMPWVLLALPLPWIIGCMFSFRGIYNAPALRVPFFEWLETTQQRHKRFHLSRTWAEFTLIWCLCVFALSGPRSVGDPQPLSRNGYNVMLVLDISGSMAINDMELGRHLVTRLSVVQRTAIQFVRDRINDRIGLILFGTRAYLLTPLTYDHQNVIMRIQDASVGLAGTTTSIGDALGLAVKRLQSVPYQGRFIILLTDGVSNSGVLTPEKAAELADARGIKVYTIGLRASAAANTFQHVFMAMNGASDLDEAMLRRVAKKTKGHYFLATDVHSLARIYTVIDRMEKISQKGEMIRPKKEYYAWPVALACGLLFFVMYRRVRS